MGFVRQVAGQNTAGEEGRRMSEMKGSIVGTSDSVSLIIYKLVMVSAADYEVRFAGLFIIIRS